MRIWLTIIGLAAFALVGFATIWWFFAISLGERQLASAQKRAAAQGYDLQYARMERGGFPLRLAWSLHGVSITQTQTDGRRQALQGTADRLHVHARPWAPQRLEFSVDGQHRWQGDTGGAAGVVVTDIAATSGRVQPRETAPGWQLAIALSGVTARSVETATEPLTIARLDAIGLVPLAMNAMDLDLTVADVTLPQDPGLGRVLESATLRAGIRPLPGSFDEQGARAWQSGGGLLTIHELQVHLGSLQGAAEGVVGLDTALRGQGNLTLRMREPQRLVASAVRAGWIKAKQQPLITMGLSLFSARGSAGEAEVALPFNLKNGGLWLGPLRLADLPPIVR